MKEGPLRALQLVNQRMAPIKLALLRLWCVWDDFHPQHERDIAATHHGFAAIILSTFGRVIGVINSIQEIFHMTMSCIVVAFAHLFDSLIDALPQLLEIFIAEDI